MNRRAKLYPRQSRFVFVIEAIIPSRPTERHVRGLAPRRSMITTHPGNTGRMSSRRELKDTRATARRADVNVPVIVYTR